MLNSLANYLLGGNISAAQDSRERSNNETPESLPVMTRLSQVEVEGEDWILIDRAGMSDLFQSQRPLRLFSRIENLVPPFGPIRACKMGPEFFYPRVRIVRYSLDRSQRPSLHEAFIYPCRLALRGIWILGNV